MKTTSKIRYKKLALALLCLLGLLLAACEQRQPAESGRPEVTPDLLSNQPQTSVTAFFETEDGLALVPLSFSINSSRDTIWIALEKLLAGPPNDFVAAVVPQGLKLKDLYFANGVVNVSLTGDGELVLDELALQAILGTVNLEMLEQDNTKAPLMLYYNDQPLLDEPYFIERVNDFGGGSEGAYVYYSDAQGMYVVPLSLPIFAADYETDEAFFAALLAVWAGQPAAESGLYPVLPADVSLNGVSLADGCLTLDLSAGLLQMSGSAQETMFLNSLFATLSPYAAIDSVRLLVEGEQVDYLAHGVDISQPLPLEHSTSMINPVLQ